MCNFSCDIVSLSVTNCFRSPWYAIWWARSSRGSPSCTNTDTSTGTLCETGVPIRVYQQSSRPVRCTSQVYQSNVLVECNSRVYQSVVSIRWTSQVYQSGVAVKCTSQVHELGGPVMCTSEVYESGGPARCTSQVYRSGVPDWCPVTGTKLATHTLSGRRQGGCLAC